MLKTAFAAAVLLFASPALSQTQMPCADRADVVSRLAERYGETLQSMGLNQNNTILEVYASEETGTWTILLSRADGTACLVAAGQMWDGTPAQAPVGDPA
jgi:hypothetical protein